jgi:glyoxylase-like metal-dependent hydrolase (beta-lactamase superfamily II)
MTEIHPIKTGFVRVKEAQRQRRTGGLVRTLTDPDWSEWLPIYAWLIEHPEGLFLVDTGETARSGHPEYFPQWHPYYRWAMEVRVSPEDEIDAQLETMGLKPQDIDTVILTHLHTDHMGGIRHFPECRFLAAPGEVRRASGILGALRGYLPRHLPDWFSPQPAFSAQGGEMSPFDMVCPLTSDGSIAVVPTPGHTPDHLSVLVASGGVRYFLAGDASYTQEALLGQRPDGVSPSPGAATRTLSRILALAAREPLVYLPSHDPDAERRLDENEPIAEGSAAGALVNQNALG